MSTHFSGAVTDRSHDKGRKPLLLRDDIPHLPVIGIVDAGGYPDADPFMMSAFSPRSKVLKGPMRGSPLPRTPFVPSSSSFNLRPTVTSYGKSPRAAPSHKSQTSDYPVMPRLDLSNAQLIQNYSHRRDSTDKFIDEVILDLECLRELEGSDYMPDFVSAEPEAEVAAQERQAFEDSEDLSEFRDVGGGGIARIASWGACRSHIENVEWQDPTLHWRMHMIEQRKMLSTRQLKKIYRSTQLPDHMIQKQVKGSPCEESREGRPAETLANMALKHQHLSDSQIWKIHNALAPKTDRPAHRALERHGGFESLDSVAAHRPAGNSLWPGIERSRQGDSNRNSVRKSYPPAKSHRSHKSDARLSFPTVSPRREDPAIVQFPVATNPPYEKERRQSNRSDTVDPEAELEMARHPVPDSVVLRQLETEREGQILRFRVKDAQQTKPSPRREMFRKIHRQGQAESPRARKVESQFDPQSMIKITSERLQRDARSWDSGAEYVQDLQRHKEVNDELLEKANLCDQMSSKVAEFVEEAQASHMKINRIQRDCHKIVSNAYEEIKEYFGQPEDPEIPEQQAPHLGSQISEEESLHQKRTDEAPGCLEIKSEGLQTTSSRKRSPGLGLEAVSQAVFKEPLPEVIKNLSPKMTKTKIDPFIKIAMYSKDHHKAEELIDDVRGSERMDDMDHTKWSRALLETAGTDRTDRSQTPLTPMTRSSVQELDEEARPINDGLGGQEKQKVPDATTGETLRSIRHTLPEPEGVPVPANVPALTRPELNSREGDASRGGAAGSRQPGASREAGYSREGGPYGRPGRVKQLTMITDNPRKRAKRKIALPKRPEDTVMLRLCSQ